MPQLRVLVADDRPEITQLIQVVLSRAGCETVAVQDGREAAARVCSEHFDVIVLDAVMPHNGLSVLEHLALRHPEMLRKTIVMTAAYANPRVMERIVAIDPCTILPKPFDINDLIEAVARTCAAPEPYHGGEGRRIERCEP